LLCKHIPCEQIPFVKELYFTEVHNFFSRDENIEYKMYYFVIDTSLRMLFGMTDTLDKEGEEEVELVK
jgi:hypothetical protein